MLPPHASAMMRGGETSPDICGTVRFYQTEKGVLIAAEINGLPYSDRKCGQSIFAFHIHGGASCSGEADNVFSGAMAHYDPSECRHPFHAGDLPPLFGNRGYAFSVFMTDRFSLSEVLGRTLIIHANPDDFTTQPSGNAGERLACGVITAYSQRHIPAPAQAQAQADKQTGT